jgi:DivIVA domain-containing protein
MGTVLLVLVVVLVIAGLVYGVVTLLAGEDPGLSPSDPDGRARPLPNNRSLSEYDLKTVRFDVGFRGYRMTQVDRVLRRTAYDIGYKDEMIAVLEAEVIALREGRVEDAELLRKAREQAAAPPTLAPVADRAAGGAHRVGVDESDEISSDDDEYEDASLESASDESPVEEDDEPDPDDPTAPGLLNRAALRRVELPDHGSAAPSAEPGPEASTSVEPSPASETDSSEPDSPAGESEASDGGAARGAERRART